MAIPASKSILVVEDVEAERTLISAYLRQQGYRLFHAHDGLDGVHKARLLVPDLILMDVDMPVCNGYDACRILSQDIKTRSVPVIFLSAYSAPEQRVEGLLVGGVDFISKPFNFDEVRLRLAIHLNRPPVQGAECGEVALEDSAGVTGATSGEGSEVADAYSVDTILFYSARVHLLSALSVTPDLAELAHLVGTNSKRLNAAFRNCVGVTVFEYLREERMKEARRLLQNTQYSIGEIASRIGFSSGANFSTAFSARFGSSPARFRRESGQCVEA